MHDPNRVRCRFATVFEASRVHLISAFGSAQYGSYRNAHLTAQSRSASITAVSASVQDKEERDAVLAAYRTGFREAYACTPDALASDRAGNFAARTVILAREPWLNADLADSRVARIVSRELLGGPVAFWESILRTTG